jgi:hypothetical protein
VLATKLIHLDRHTFDISTVGAATIVISDNRTARDSVAVRAGTLVSAGIGRREVLSCVEMLNKKS